MNFIDTHAHIEGTEFDADRDEVVARAKAVGVRKILVPSIDLPSLDKVLDCCSCYPDFAYPMIGLHPEEVKDDWRIVLAQMRKRLFSSEGVHYVAIGEVGLDFYWSREYEDAQRSAFEEQLHWSIETKLPLMIHCRNAQSEMLHIMQKYADKLHGGVFHCFTGSAEEAAEFLAFDNFLLGIGGVLTFKKSHLPEVVRSMPLDCIVLETDSPYMAPVPMRGKRNESAFVKYVLDRLAECYGVSPEKIAEATNANVAKVFPRCFKNTFFL